MCGATGRPPDNDIEHYIRCITMALVSAGDVHPGSNRVTLLSQKRVCRPEP